MAATALPQVEVWKSQAATPSASNTFPTLANLEIKTKVGTGGDNSPFIVVVTEWDQIDWDGEVKKRKGPVLILRVNEDASTDVIDIPEELDPTTITHDEILFIRDDVLENVGTKKKPIMKTTTTFTVKDNTKKIAANGWIKNSGTQPKLALRKRIFVVGLDVTPAAGNTRRLSPFLINSSLAYNSTGPEFGTANIVVCVNPAIQDNQAAVASVFANLARRTNVVLAITDMPLTFTTDLIQDKIGKNVQSYEGGYDSIDLDLLYKVTDVFKPSQRLKDALTVSTSFDDVVFTGLKYFEAFTFDDDWLKAIIAAAGDERIEAVTPFNLLYQEIYRLATQASNLPDLSDLSAIENVKPDAPVEDKAYVKLVIYDSFLKFQAHTEGYQAARNAAAIDTKDVTDVEFVKDSNTRLQRLRVEVDGAAFTLFLKWSNGEITEDILRDVGQLVKDPFQAPIESEIDNATIFKDLWIQYHEAVDIDKVIIAVNKLTPKAERGAAFEWLRDPKILLPASLHLTLEDVFEESDLSDLLENDFNAVKRRSKKIYWDIVTFKIDRFNVASQDFLSDSGGGPSAGLMLHLFESVWEIGDNEEFLESAREAQNTILEENTRVGGAQTKVAAPPRSLEESLVLAKETLNLIWGDTITADQKLKNFNETGVIEIKHQIFGFYSNANDLMGVIDTLARWVNKVYTPPLVATTITPTTRLPRIRPSRPVVSKGEEKDVVTAEFERKKFWYYGPLGTNGFSYEDDMKHRRFIMNPGLRPERPTKW
jgi:hypothetical protein